MNSDREKDIINKVLKGDPDPFGVLVREHQRAIYSLMLRYTGNADEASDLAQEAFIKAYGKLESFDKSKRFFPWLYTLALNIARDWIRKRGREQKVIVPESMDINYHPDDSTSQSQTDKQLDGAKAFDTIMGLGHKYREALILRFKYGFSFKEVASTLEISLSGAKMRVRRGLDMVKDSLMEDNDEQ
ncbi:RNA polymerase sigma factor, sigma-70 family [Pseudodesulfovibrio profundus]|uniref:RNA polymerase sigma factor, sigma-70 family n=1 Tax=Pseudodesulfovibrio profundus TaxID=57320 RepID=A0A2C8F5K1_9BACT|nr:RNA polymerase sigma factor [Pseudodesulfovibrio profundus]SOB57301.1 RNA polymerase sigma factor, sigma-70 family [Pseudodesulfovibrio profundus]